MKRKFYVLITIMALAFILPAFSPALSAKTRVVTSYAYIADLVKQVGGDEVSVKALAKGTRDPHYITPKPSFIAKLRKADLLVINGGQLEIGWLPPVIRQAGNGNVQPGKKGFMSLMDLVEAIEVPEHVSRAHGDVHPEGNPHIQLDPHHIPIFAKAITEKLCELEPSKCETFKKNYGVFENKWKTKLAEWEKVLLKLNHIKVVEYHKLYQYLFNRYHVDVIGTLEPLPGIPPTPKHIAKTIDLVKEKKARFIVQDVYHSSKTARYVSGKTGVKMIVLPHDVGAVKEAKDIFTLFDEITRRLGGS